MNNSPAEIARQLLVDLGIGVAPATPPSDWMAYDSSEPSIPDNCLTIYDTAGSSDGRYMHDGELRYHYGLQFRIRSKDHPTGWVKADALRTALSQVYVQHVTIGSTNYVVHAITKIGEILVLGKDAPNSKRSLFTVNTTIAFSPYIPPPPDPGIQSASMVSDGAGGYNLVMVFDHPVSFGNLNGLLIYVDGVYWDNGDQSSGSTVDLTETIVLSWAAFVGMPTINPGDPILLSFGAGAFLYYPSTNPTAGATNFTVTNAL